MGQELQLPPMQALNSINVIQGKPCLSAQLMVGLVRNRIPSCDIKFNLNEDGLIAVCKVKRNIQSEEWDYISTWDMAKAKSMGLVSKDNYRKQPINMLKWRAASEAIRAVFPDVLMGAYALEEFTDFDGKEIVDVENLNMSPAEIEEEFPIPENEKEIGSPDFRILKSIQCMNVKFGNKQLKEIDPEILTVWYEKRDAEIATGKKLGDEVNVIFTSVAKYLTDLETHTYEGSSL